MKIFSLRFCISFSSAHVSLNIPYVLSMEEVDTLFSVAVKVAVALPEQASPEWLAGLLKNEALQQKSHILYLIFDNDNEMNACWEKLQLLFGRVEAAGGVVLNPANEILLMHRKGWIDLPKGKLDAGETLPECALREVAEETGLKTHILGKQLPTTYHVYRERKTGWVVKPTAWFMMHCKENEKPVPQTEEDITEIEWVPKDKLAEKFPGMYPLIQDVLAGL